MAYNKISVGGPLGRASPPIGEAIGAVRNATAPHVSLSQTTYGTGTFNISVPIWATKATIQMAGAGGQGAGYGSGGTGGTGGNGGKIDFSMAVAPSDSFVLKVGTGTSVPNPCFQGGAGGGCSALYKNNVLAAVAGGGGGGGAGNGSGGVGGAITGDNITVHHLYNTKRLAYELTPPPEAAMVPGSTDDPAQLNLKTTSASQAVGAADIQIDEIVRRVLAELKK